MEIEAKIRFYKGNINVSNFDRIANEIYSYGDEFDCDDEIVPANIYTINRAIELYEKACKFGFETEPHLISDGCIDLVFFIKNTDHFLDVKINSDCKISYIYEIGKGRKYITKDRKIDCTVADIILKLGKIKKTLCVLSESSTMKDTTPKAAADFLQNVLIGNLEEVYPLYQKTAPLLYQKAFASIYLSTPTL